MSILTSSITELSKAANISGTDKGTDNLNKSDSMGDDIHYGYTEVYDSYFNEIRQRKDKVYILELGIFHGKSLNMYNEYFGTDKCEIYALDIDDKSEYNSDNIHTFIVDQSNKEQLENFVKYIKEQGITFDIILDDASHVSWHQIQTLGSFQYIISKEAIYIIEDIYANLHDYAGNYTGFYHDTTIMFLMRLTPHKALYDSEYFDLLGKIKYTQIISLPSLIGLKNNFLSFSCITALIKFK